MNSLSKSYEQDGFTIIEMLVTIVVSLVFVGFFYQLFVGVSTLSSEARRDAAANDVAMKILKKYPTTQSVTGTAACPSSTDTQSFTNQTDAYIKKYDYSIEFSCPYSSMTSITRVVVTVTYGSYQARQVAYVN
jgi:prepilin-type N-terminal cleavage/methylation domain-containing protein